MQGRSFSKSTIIFRCWHQLRWGRRLHHCHSIYRQIHSTCSLIEKLMVIHEPLNLHAMCHWDSDRIACEGREKKKPFCWLYRESQLLLHGVDTHTLSIVCFTSSFVELIQIDLFPIRNALFEIHTIRRFDFYFIYFVCFTWWLSPVNNLSEHKKPLYPLIH